jgi:nucleotide-binding universal stress UspA family protein
VPDGVCEAIEHLRADLLVIGRGHHGARLPSKAYAIVRESPCPVVSV